MVSSPYREKLLRLLWGVLPLLLLSLLIITIAVMYVRIKGEEERIRAEKRASMHKERPPVNVVVLDVVPSPIRDSLNLPAQAEAWVELKVLAEVSGTITALGAHEGAYVRKGDLIAVIDTRDYENALTSIRAEYDLARKNLERTRNLFEENLITRAQFDNDLSRVENLEASLKNAELRLERCHIRAPIDGVINRLDAKVGLYTNVQDPVAVMLDIKRVKVSVGIPESDVHEVRGLERFDVTFSALGRTVEGKRHFFSRSPESFAHLYKLEIEIPNPAGDILPGMFARVNIVKKVVKDGFAVPLYSVLSRGDEQLVFTEADGKARARKVETGIIEGWKIQITSGLAAQDRVIVVGHRSVDEGQEVNVVRTVTDLEELFK